MRDQISHRGEEQRMTKKLLLVLVIVLTVVLAIPSARADDFVIREITDPTVITDPNCCTPFTKTVVSDTTTMVTKLNGVPTSRHAVAAWEAFGDPVDPTPSVWDSNLNYNFTPAGADWIWESYRTVHPLEGDIVYFQKTFSISGYPTAGTLHITCDNGYEAWLNGHLVGSDGLWLGWETSNRTNSFVYGGWPTVEAWDVSGLLKTGTNTLIVKAANEYHGTLDGETLGTIDNNPAGLIFQLNMSGNACQPSPCPSQSMTVVSDTTTKVIKANTGLQTPYNAVAAWEAFGDPVDPIPSTWDSKLNYNFTPAGADWIWESYRTVHPLEGDIVYFQKTFTIGGYPTAGTLHITCDNGYQAWLNGNLVGSDGLFPGWETSNRTNSFVYGGWTTVEAWDVSGLLKTGTNTLIVKAANEYHGTLDGETLGTIDNNPAGLIFQLDMSGRWCPD
jgi:hypothetical protein